MPLQESSPTSISCQNYYQVEVVFVWIRKNPRKLARIRSLLVQSVGRVILMEVESVVQGAIAHCKKYDYIDSR